MFTAMTLTAGFFAFAGLYATCHVVYARSERGICTMAHKGLAAKKKKRCKQKTIAANKKVNAANKKVITANKKVNAANKK